MVGATFALVSLCITCFMAAMDTLKRSPWIQHGVAEKRRLSDILRMFYLVYLPAL